MESKRLFLAMVLSVAIVLVYEWWSLRLAPPQPPQPAPAGRPAPAGQAPGAGVPGQGAVQGPVQGAVPASPGVAPAAPTGRRVAVRTGRFEARFDTANASLTELRLLGYRTTVDRDSPPVAVAELPAGALVPVAGGPAAGGAARAVPPGTTYEVEPAGGLTLGPGEQGTLTFTATTPAGLRIVNRYVFEGGSLAFRVEQVVTNTASEPTELHPVLIVRHGRDLGLEKASGYTAGAVALAPGGVRRLKFGEVTGGERVAGPVEWAGWQEKYFTGLVLPKEPAVGAVVVRERPAMVAARDAVAAPEPVGEVELLYPKTTVVPGGNAGVSAQVYMGPKDVGTLRAVDPSLERVIDFGFFHWIAMPLLLTLRWIHGFVGNYGVAIVVLTVLVKLVFWPLTAKQIKSAKAMQKLQPLMSQLREKHKNDREAMNREMMELFRRHNVNPLMGCLPLLVQMPVFFALYRVLSNSIELRHAPFVGWIQDLSAADPYYVYPILMGLAWFVTQKMTPVAGDPTQQKVMLLIPVLSTLMFLWMPSGLVLYWLVTNVLQIGQQVYTNRLVA